jgi:hypothetical protein
MRFTVLALLALLLPLSAQAGADFLTPAEQAWVFPFPAILLSCIAAPSTLQTAAAAEPVPPYCYPANEEMNHDEKKMWLMTKLP